MVQVPAIAKLTRLRHLAFASLRGPQAALTAGGLAASEEAALRLRHTKQLFELGTEPRIVRNGRYSKSTLRSYRWLEMAAQVRPGTADY